LQDATGLKKIAENPDETGWENFVAKANSMVAD
jgi:hypothetical protein